MNIHGWGRYQQINADIITPNSDDDYRQYLSNGPLIARGNGRSYGDSALAERVMSMLDCNQLLAFDAANGILHCESGVLLGDIINVFLEQGWFPGVVPGTQWITVGGAIASDIHGKNHHLVGCFSEFVKSFKLLLPSGDIVQCSRSEHPKLFHATCGGMGLTGIILSAELQLIKVPGDKIIQSVTPTRNWQSLLELFNEKQKATYSVAWLDCLARGKHFGRGLFITGEHATDEQSPHLSRPAKSFPAKPMSWLLNKYSMRAFNAHYYRNQKRSDEQHISLEDYFFPLDSVRNWNQFYGKRGFIQYQCVLPLHCAEKALTEVFNKLQDSGESALLAVLKRFGDENQNLLSFPMPGFTLALDFKASRQLPDFIKQLDDVVSYYGGRVYLTKDALVSAETFERMEPDCDPFRQLRAELGADKIFNSLQSIRLNL
jgi:decaprenylphospho-beta-D-ribofuranose 2-oxidase